MWQVKTFPFKTVAGMDAARAKMQAWLKAREGRIQFETLFVNNGFGIQWRWLR